MSDLSIVVSTSGIEEMLRRLDPKNADRALIIWYDRGTKYVSSELRNRAPSRLRGKVDDPHRWPDAATVGTRQSQGSAGAS